MQIVGFLIFFYTIVNIFLIFSDMLITLPSINSVESRIESMLLRPLTKSKEAISAVGAEFHERFRLGSAHQPESERDVFYPSLIIS